MSHATEIETTPRDKILAVAHELGILMIADFVPWSQSRNKHEKSPSLNWRVQLDLSPQYGSTHGILTTDYSAGCGHAPSYTNKPNTGSKLRHDAIVWECEHGKQARILPSGGMLPIGRPLQPDLADVLYSLASDSYVIDCGSFEEWASNFGYDTDSRKAESTYRQCLEIALKLRNAIGEDGLQRLREACQDY